MQTNVIPIFFSLDDAYAPCFDCAIRSMVQNASKTYDYRIYVLYQELSDANRKRLSMAIKKPFSISFIPMRTMVQEIMNREENRLRCDYFTLTDYFRLFIAELFPQYDKGIYLDSDVIVPGDISKLYEMNLEEHALGACPDYSVSQIPELLRYMEYAIGVPAREYVNSGVLLLNLAKLREDSFCTRFLHLFHTYHFDCIAPNQDYINAMCNGSILYFDTIWNTMPLSAGKGHMLAHPQLIHYNLFQKPWHYDNIPYESYFWKYAKQSLFYEEIVAHKNSYSDVQKKADTECLTNLIEKSAVIDRQDITFRKIHENKECIRIQADC